MKTPQVVSWAGYDFTCYDASQTDWMDLPGIYIFARVSANARWWQAVYVGKTLSFEMRLGDAIKNHEHWPEARSLGATHVHALVVSDETQRNMIEFLLIDSYGPLMNVKNSSL